MIPTRMVTINIITPTTNNVIIVCACDGKFSVSWALLSPQDVVSTSAGEKLTSASLFSAAGVGLTSAAVKLILLSMADRGVDFYCGAELSLLPVESVTLNVGLILLLCCGTDFTVVSRRYRFDVG